ncbi:MAG: hypothetical protein ABW136_12545 [Steroidobacteraceae bacterium]
MNTAKIALSLVITTALLAGTAVVSTATAADSDYRVVEKNGKKMYCSKRLATGSHLKKQQTCLTQEELDQLKEETERGLKNISRQAPPPRGT